MFSPVTSDGLAKTSVPFCLLAQKTYSTANTLRMDSKRREFLRVVGLS
jgi:hypothetical protein